ncbi:carboxylesterase family protein [Orrella daihaiensis]|uniref:Carboxylic ester hydrolase n=1 Tax=Orrella daihaiensis TaxID=2782176 RepID=A0ABY4AJC8_9BURK|nr:carboxylesterase family protein [Orrella daihaiensis]UOD50058.1 carboxylesterase family protein [Orrella daihaiensis]
MLYAGLTANVFAKNVPVVIQTPSGSIKGQHNTNAGVNEFRGIQYATADRFEPPVPVSNWAGILAATKFGSNCPQAARFNLTEESLEENCLYLNVTTPDNAKPDDKLPVLVWIHGGGFVGGGSNLYRLDRIAREANVVVVSLNYRTGLFGFMPHPAIDVGINGNLGLEDQRAALRWVQKNIASFGGDPDNVTLAGESAGTGLICLHLASPEAVRGAFHKAILISGACLQQIPTLEQALADPIWEAVSHNPKDSNRKFRCPVPGDKDYSDQASLACLKNQSVSDLLQAQTYEAGNRLLSFVPVTGNKTVPRSFHEAVGSGNIMKVPMIMGSATHELRLYIAYDVLGDNGTKTEYPVTIDNVNQYYLPAFYGTDAAIHQKILQRYFGDATNPMNLNGATLGSMLSSYNPYVGINNCLHLQTANTLNGVAGMPPIYQFEFSDPNALVLGVGLAPGKDPGFELGAVHSSILNYLFPNFSNTMAINAPDLPPASDELASQMIAYISRFMRGDEDFSGFPAQWNAYDGSQASPASENVLLFRPNEIKLFNAYGGLSPDSTAGHQCAFWNSMYPN